MEHIFKYKLDKFSKRFTTFLMFVAVLIFLYLYIFTQGSYLPAWFTSIAFAIILLYILSIPRYIKVDDSNLEIHCVVEMTRVRLEDIDKIEKIDNKRFKQWFPLLGSYGFFGYYGYYISMRSFNVFKVYASQKRNLIRIKDIYEDVLIVSCTDPDSLINLVNNKVADLKKHS